MIDVQSGQLDLAMSAAYTFSVAHPNHEYMGSNVEQYRAMPEAKAEYFVDMEEKPFQVGEFLNKWFHNRLRSFASGHADD